MKIKNVSGQTQYFRFGKRGVEVPDDGIVNVAIPTFPPTPGADEEKAFNDALAYQRKGLIEILEGPSQTQYQGNRSLPATGWVWFDSNVNTDDEVTIDGQVYQFTAATAADDAIKVTPGGDVAATIVNFVTAVNDNEKSPVYAINLNGSSKVTLVAKEVGPSGNTIALESDGSTRIVDSGGFSGGYFGSVFPVISVVHEVTAEDVLYGIDFDFGVPAISSIIVQVRDSDGVIAPFDGPVVVNDGTVRIENATGGSRDLEAGDVVTILVTA